MVNLIPWKRRGSREVKPYREEEFHPMAEFRRELNELWDRFLQDWDRGLSLWQEPTFGMTAGLEDKEDEYLFHVDLPGFDPEDIDIKVSGNWLSVRAEHKEEEKGREGGTYHYGSFQRSFTLPHGVDADKIDARYQRGILEVHLPKTEEAHPKRISVKAE